MHNKHFILHLTLIENIGPAIIQRILQRSDISVSDLYSFSQADWMNTFGFTETAAENLADGLANKKILEVELDLIERHNIQWAVVADETYPQLLREIYLPPAVLYWQGLLSSARPAVCSEAFGEGRKLVEGFPRAPEKLLAIVGARKANGYGQRVVDTIVPELVAAGYTIVSGGALGIDTMAHAATVACGGKTIAVLGSGLLCPYPSSNNKLFKSIVDHGGAMVSSFPLTMEALPGHFPARNRIITGLSRGCLVVQAAKKSGALISAHYAMEQGREVFAVPGLIDDELSVGCNALIQQGAKLIMNAADILQEFGDRVIIDNRVIQEKVKQLSLESFQCARQLDPIFSSFNGDPNENEVEIGAKGYPRALQDTLQPVQGERERIYKLDKVVDKYSNYSASQKLIIAACKQLTSFDLIINATQLTSETVQSELFNLQLDGVVSQDFTGMWVVQ